MNSRFFSRCGITLAVLLGSQRHLSYNLRPANLLMVCSFVSPFARTSTTPSVGGVFTAAVARVAFALPTACASSSYKPQQQHHCPSSRQQHHQPRRQQRKRLPTANMSSSGASAAAAAAAAAAPGAAAGAATLAEGGSSTPPTDPPSSAAARSPEAVGRGKARSGLEVDGAHMRRALDLAAKGLGHTRPNPAVGCVILDKEGRVVGEGFHPRAGEPHAEVWAIRQAGERARGGTAYVSLEPCNHFGRTPPCTTALLECGVARVVAGMVDPDPRTAGSGLRRLADAGIDVSVGVEGAACHALNSAFVHRVSHQSCYGVLHCCLDGAYSRSIPQSGSRAGVGGLQDRARENDLAVPPGGRNFEEYDAIVVEGRSGVAKLEACNTALPPTALRVVIVGARSDEGLETELAGVLESRLLEESPERTVVFMPATAGQDGDGSLTGSVRASLMSRGVAVVDFRTPDTPTPPASSLQEERPETATAAATMAAAAGAVSRELFRRGMLSAAWEVGPAMAAVVLRAGHVQRALIRRRRIPGGGGADAGGASTNAPAAAARVGAHVGQNESVSGSDKGVAGGSVTEEEEEEVLRVMRRLSGREGVRVRRGGGMFPWGPDAESFIEVLLPTTPLEPPASA
ncbi:unnamed protein product [Ectocarpus sp. CCAP 1310/34]|nr:unnamed protein product [Ectocarpus sp. CCAP 1310/34]